MSVNDFELNILEILKEDARTEPSRIAVMTGSDENTVRESIRSMEARGILVKYPAMINWDLAGGEEVEVHELVHDAVAQRQLERRREVEGEEGAAEERPHHHRLGQRRARPQRARQQRHSQAQARGRRKHEGFQICF